jgi:hypothetical protein
MENFMSSIGPFWGRKPKSSFFQVAAISCRSAFYRQSRRRRQLELAKRDCSGSLEFLRSYSSF